MRVLLVDDHTPTREQVAGMIGLNPDLDVVASVGSGEDAIEMVRQLRPDIVVMDIMLPGMNGIDATRCIVSEFPGTQILALSNHSGPALVRAILDAGGLGYVRKNRASEELVTAIRAVGAGKQYIGDNAK